MAKKKNPTETSKQVDELARETKETIELLEAKDDQIKNLEADLIAADSVINAYENHFGKLPTPAIPKSPLKQTCLHKDQHDCRMLYRIDKKKGSCLKLRRDVDLTQPVTDCEYFRQSIYWMTM